MSESVTVGTGDGAGSLTVGEGTRARDANGNPLGEVTIARATAGLPPVPPGATIGFALDCGPAGATFDPPATLTYTLSEEEWGRIGNSATLRVMWYNPGTGAWQEVPATVDPATRTVTAEVSHFSLFALTWAAAPRRRRPPARPAPRPGCPVRAGAAHRGETVGAHRGRVRSSPRSGGGGISSRRDDRSHPSSSPKRAASGRLREIVRTARASQHPSMTTPVLSEQKKHPLAAMLEDGRSPHPTADRHARLTGN